ncbi:unnamed protein product [Lymnaea stagnalis]|uniref:Uncharacterized protein n=1 Tax=Lymnaea stagnalis TaxID=6523 RepID=A0AAV2IIR2_LYMST
MHISIQDIFSSFRGQQENENEGPPPSYEEALKILESAKLSTQHILGKIN